MSLATSETKLRREREREREGVRAESLASKDEGTQDCANLSEAISIARRMTFFDSEKEKEERDKCVCL